MKKPKILVVGSLVMDLIVSAKRLPMSGETVLGCDFQTASGGKGANQAVQAARLGAEVSMVGKIGRDSFGREILESVQKSGVDVSHVLVSEDKSTAIGNVQLEVADGKTANRIVVVPGANMDITLEDIDFLKEQIAEYDMVILQLEIPMEINEAVARYAYDKGVPVMLNSAPYAPVPSELLSHLAYISPNEHEAADMAGIAVTDEESRRLAVMRLMEKGIKNVLITLGDKGAVLGNTDEYLYSPCISGVKVQDPTAAGDSFVGAFCTAVCLGLNHEQALLFANCTASITVSKMGAQPSLPVLSEVLALMEERQYDTTALKRLI